MQPHSLRETRFPLCFSSFPRAPHPFPRAALWAASRKVQFFGCRHIRGRKRFPPFILASFLREAALRAASRKVYFFRCSHIRCGKRVSCFVSYRSRAPRTFSRRQRFRLHLEKFTFQMQAHSRQGTRFRFYFPLEAHDSRRNHYYQDF